MRVFLQDCIKTVIDNRGVTPHKRGTEWQDSGIMVLSANNVKTSGLQNMDQVRFIPEKIYDSWMKIPLERGDLILTSEAPAGEVYYWDSDEKVVLGQRLYGLKIKEGINSKYLKYYLQSNAGQKAIRQQQSGSTVFGISATTFQNIVVELPEKDVQDNIANILSAIDEKIDNNNAICADLEGMAKLLYDYWFVQFDFPDENGKPYKSSGGKMVWNEELKREIPEGWEAKPLSDWLLCNKHSLGQNDHYDYIEYLDTSSLTKNAISFLQHITDADAFPVRAKRIICHNDILYSTVRPEQQHFGIIKNPPKNLIASTGFAVLSCKEGAEYNDLFYHFLSSDSTTNILNTIANSSVSAYPSIVPGDILNLKICLPKKLDETRFALEKLQTFFSTIDELHKENDTLTSLRDFLLPMLMNGQVKVKGA